MGIVDDDVARVREATDIASLIGEQVALKRVGRRLVGLCPFHSENTGSFNVNPELGLWICYGCQKSGDAITFVRETEHLDFVAAVERLAARAGITLRYDDKGGGGRERERRTRLVEAVAAAIDFYHRRLLEAPDAGQARGYLRSRGLTGEVVRKFAVGWAPDDWDQLSRHLQHAKFSRDDLVEAGLAFVNKANKLQDQFRGRVMFPIYDVNGDPIAFGGRTLAEGGPKYVNTPETSIYRKRRVLYALNWAKADVVAAGEAVVCEGYTDVIACFEAGTPRAVATCGTALADDHVRLLKRFASRLVLAYDADAAGQAAAERFYAWEAEHELTLAVAALEPGRDPADVWKDDPALLRKAIAEARPFLQFRVERVLGRADRTTAEGRARAAQAAISLIGAHPNDLVRDQYVMMLSDELGIAADRLREAMGRSGRGTASMAAEPDAVPVVEPIDRRDLEGLRVAVHYPEHVPEWLDERHFRTAVAREAFHTLASSVTLAATLESAGAAAGALLQRIAVEDVADGGDPEHYTIDVTLGLLEASARRQVNAMVSSGEARASDGFRLLDELVTTRTNGEWDAAKRVAQRLVSWAAGGSPREHE